MCAQWKGHEPISNVVQPKRSDCSSSICTVAHGASINNVTSTNHVIHGLPFEHGVRSDHCALLYRCSSTHGITDSNSDNWIYCYTK